MSVIARYGTGGGNVPIIVSLDNRPNHISESVAQALTADGGGRGTQLVVIIKQDEDIQSDKPECRIQRG